MDYMKLADGTQITIEDGAHLGQIVHIAETEADAMEVCAAITPENISSVEFYSEDAEEPYGIYENLALNSAPARQTNEDETVTVTISLREKTELELRVDAFEEGQQIQDGAIEDLGLVVSDMMEG